MTQRRSLYACSFIVVLSVLAFLRASPAKAYADVHDSGEFSSLRPHVAWDEPEDGDVVQAHDAVGPAVDASENSGATADLSRTSANPVIDVWYGLHQVFGHIGVPQRWVNVLGDASDSDGIASLAYSLNGGPESSLSVGPDTRRLLSAGDFNVEIAYTDLSSGPNTVVITATDGLGNHTVETVTVEYDRGHTWPLPYAIDWSSVAETQDAAQIVDGVWTLDASGIRPAIVGYDRVIAVGDVTWGDFEVTVPITIHAIDPAGFNWPSFAPGLGIMMRWNGHTNSPVVCSQPHCGWRPYGSSTWYGWDNHDPILKLEGNNDVLLDTDPDVHLTLGTCYQLKTRVETIPGLGGWYRSKIWQDGQAEPPEWNVTGQQSLADPQNGAFVLVAHHVDVTFGDVSVVPVSDTVAPAISDIQVAPHDTTATVTWTTNEPATSSVAFGQSTAYENGSVDDATLRTAHTIVLTGLISGTLYHYQVTSADGSGNVAHSTDLTFTATFSGGAGLSNIVSDDFNACSLNTALWTWVNPRGDATWVMTGTHTQHAWISISVPGGISHTLWTDGAFAPRIMQPANDVDFDVEVKFESAVTQKYQTQGIMVEAGGDRFLRFEFFSDGVTTRVFAAGFASGSVTTYKNSPISGGAPLYMRVRRAGNQWTQFYSADGLIWTTGANFSRSFTVTAVGVYAGNDGTSSNNAPAHTGLVDYFFNVASPVILEDEGRNTLTTDVVGNGTVIENPDKSSYLCGETVVLTATAGPGWSFAGWSGALEGVANPATLAMTRSQVVTATFTQDAYTLTLNVTDGGAVHVEPSQTAYTYGETVTLTATANSGWTFAGWSGDLSGADNPATVTIAGNTVITATFTRNEYALTIHIVGDGSVVVDPAPGPYRYDDVVTLTATPDPGWSFTGWSGDLIGSTPSITTTMTANKVITASFAVEAENYQIFLPSVVKGGPN